MFRQTEQEYSRHNFDAATTEMLLRHFEDAEAECARLLAQPAEDPKTGKPTRVRFEERDGKKVRVAVRSGELING